MSKKLDNTLNKALKSLLSRLEKTEAFVLDQAPDVCKQMVKEKVIENGMILAVSAFFLAIAAFSSYECFTYLMLANHDSDASFGYGFGLLVSVLASVAASISVFGAVNALLYVKYCPKLFLIREFKKLLE